jgi:starch-binding outer membrane protein, SusD/RagB family
MKNLFKLFVAPLCVILLNSSCEKLLEVNPESQITEQVYFQNEGDFEPYVTGIYTFMRSIANNITYGTERSEELIPALNSRFGQAWTHNITPTVGAVDYNNWYRSIGHCNLLLEKIEGFPFASSPEVKNRIKAEAYCLRAYTYFSLVRIIGDTPLMLQAVTDENVPLLPRSKAGDVMKQIIADLDLALSLFPAKTFSSKYRFSYPAAQALKAEAKLWSAKVLGGGVQNFNDAIVAVEEVEKAGLILRPNFRDVTTVRANEEIILAAYYNRDETNSNYGLNALPYLTGLTGALNLDSIPWAATTSNGQGAYQISRESRALFSAKPQDKRIPSTWILERHPTSTKIAWISRYPGNKYPDDRVSDNDIIIFRLADVYLMAAEAYAALDNSTKAIEYLNKVRLRAGNGEYTGNQDKGSLEREILDERGREFFFENKRWYDLVRFHKGGTIDVYNYVPNLKGKTTPLFWPLAANVLANNSSLTQTEGYSN